MDRGTASSTIFPFLCFLSFLFTFSSARNPFESAMIDIDHVNRDPLSLYYEENLAQHDPNSILIPIDRPLPEPVTVIRLEPEPKTDNSKLTEPKPDIVYSTELPKETPPDPNAAFITSDLRPIDPRSIPRRPVPLSFRLGHRCNYHQSHNRHYKPWKPAQHLPRREIPRPDDVKSNGVEMEKEIDRVERDWARQVPAEPMRVRNIEPKLSRDRERELALEKNELWRRIYPRHHRHEAKKKDTAAQLMKRIRKFLNPF